MTQPYYNQDGITIYHGDCRDVLPLLEPFDLLLTDPPYPDQHAELYGYQIEAIAALKSLECRQFIFWSAKTSFPLDSTAVHIWDKKTGCGSEYERVYERKGAANFKVFSHYLINSSVAASYCGEVFTGHPSQKPIALLMAILKYAGLPLVLVDPFVGSGSSLVAAKRSGICAIGIEKNESYCEMAAKRLAQSVLPFEMAG